MSDHQSPKEILQSILQNVHTGGNLNTGDITQMLNPTTVVIKQIDSFKPTEIPQNVPRSPKIKFVGRAEELERLHQMLQQNSQIVLAAIEGMGGVGKTELATQYALIHLPSTYTGGICWLKARDEDVGIQIVQFAKAKLGLEPPEDWDLIHQVDFCWSRWYQGNVLVVLDDVNDYQKVEPYLPLQSSRFKVLITTRLQLDDLTELSRFTLDVLSESAAIELLEGWIGASKIERELADAKELCQWLSYLPLALNLVGRYVKKRKLSCSEMLRRLKEKKLSHESLVHDSNDRTWTLNIKRGVEAAFELSWDELSEFAQGLGCLLSLFEVAPIPWSLVESAAPEQDPEKLEYARVELENLHLIQGENPFGLHRLIHEFFNNKQNNLGTTDQKKLYFFSAMLKVGGEIPETPILEEINQIALVMPHVAKTVITYKDWLRDEDLVLVFMGFGRFYKAQGAYAKALCWLEQCLSVARKCFGENHPHTAASYNFVAELYRLQGCYSEAEPLYQKALEILQRLLGEDHLIAGIYNNLALLYQSQGRYNKAEPLLKKALELMLQISGEENIDVGRGYNNLAELYRLQGCYSEAEPLFQKALELRQRLLGENHLDTATSYNNLAELYRLQGCYSEAKPLYLKALELFQKLQAEDHPTTAIIYNNLALFYHSQRRYTEAESLFKKALELKQCLLGEEHPSVATSYNNLAGLYCSQGRYSEAELLYQKALAICKHKLGVAHPSTINVRKNYADLLKIYAAFLKEKNLDSDDKHYS